MRATFNQQLSDNSKKEEYKRYITEKEAQIDKIGMNKSFYISEYLSCVDNKLTEEKILKYIDIVMNEMYYSKYTSFVWEYLASQVISNKGNDETKLLPILEQALHRIIGSCEEKNTF